MERIIGLICFLSSLWSCSPINDELSDDLKDDLTYRLEWSGDRERFSIGNEGLRLDDKEKEAGSAFLTTPASQIRGTRWEFRVHLFFNPSVNNHARFYLASSSNKLSGTLNGYFLQIGGSKDQVSLYRQEGIETTLLASGRELMKGNDSPELTIKAECDDNGYWTFWTRLKEETNYIKEKQVRDTEFTQSVCAGVYCFYTATRCNGFLFSHIQITPDGAETTTETEEPEVPEEPVVPEKPESQVKGLLFNEVMYHNASNGVEYVELYNHSTKSLSLLGMQLEKQKLDGTPIVRGKVPLTNEASNPTNVAPGAYICFTQSTKVLKKKHQVDKVTLVELPNFPILSNKGGILVLLSAQGEVLDRCVFADEIHAESKQGKPGTSLEKSSPFLASDKTENWFSSENETGGTPSTRNSIEN